MKITSLIFMFVLPCLSVAAKASPSATEDDPGHRLAVLPLPADLRGGAGIVKWTPEGKVEAVKPSANGYSCSLDDPSDEVFDVRCYADGMWPALEMRYQLSSNGKARLDVYAAIEAALESGDLEIPMWPTAGYRMLGPIDAINLETGETGPAMNDWQSIHFPFRTSEEMGLTEADEMRQDDPMPFVMASGRWWSHVMIMHGEWKPLQR